MYEIKSDGDRIDHGTYTTRYGMTGDTYLTYGEVGDRADALWTAARAGVGSTRWFVQIAVRLGLARSGVGELEASFILAKAGVTWSDICRIKS